MINNDSIDFFFYIVNSPINTSKKFEEQIVSILIVQVNLIIIKNKIITIIKNEENKYNPRNKIKNKV